MIAHDILEYLQERDGFYAPDIPRHVKRDGFWSNIKNQSIQVSRLSYIILLFSLSLSPCSIFTYENILL